MRAIARYEEQLRDQIGSNSVVGRADNGGLEVGWLWVVKRRNGRRSRKKRLGMTRGRERRRLEGNKSPVIRVRPRHRPVDPVTQSTYWPRLGAPDGGRSTWAQVQLYSGLPSGARAAGQGVGGSDLDLAHVPVSRYPSWSRYMAHHCDTPDLQAAPGVPLFKSATQGLNPSLTRPWELPPQASYPAGPDAATTST